MYVLGEIGVCVDRISPKGDFQAIKISWTKKKAIKISPFLYSSGLWPSFGTTLSTKN